MTLVSWSSALTSREGMSSLSATSNAILKLRSCRGRGRREGEREIGKLWSILETRRGTRSGKHWQTLIGDKHEFSGTREGGEKCIIKNSCKIQNKNCYLVVSIEGVVRNFVRDKMVQNCTEGQAI